MAWFIIDFEYAAKSPCLNDDMTSKFSKNNHAPEIFTKEIHDTSVDIWSIGYLIADSGITITCKALDELKYSLLGTDRPKAEIVKMEINKIHTSLCSDTGCSFNKL